MSEALDVLPFFPYSRPKSSQRAMLEFIAANHRHRSSTIVAEAPTGTGKTAVGVAFLKVYGARRTRPADGPLLYVVPTKALVDQVCAEFPKDTVPVYGRGDYECLFFDEEEAQLGRLYNADEIPCPLLDCRHRVEIDSGEVFEPGATPCPYLWAKHHIRTEEKIVVCSMAYYLFAQWYQRLWPQPYALVIDEAHDMARAVRGCLTFDITDWHLWRGVRLLETVQSEQAQSLKKAATLLTKLVKRYPPHQPKLMEDEHIEQMITAFQAVDTSKLQGDLKQAVVAKLIDPTLERDTLLRIQRLTYSLGRYIKALDYSLPTEDRNPLNYTYAFYEHAEEDDCPEASVHHRLSINAFYVAPIIKRILGRHNLAMSATIGDEGIFEYESGIGGAFLSVDSEFPVKNTRIFVPTDTPNLAARVRSRQEPAKVLRRIVKACARFASKGLRSLVVVVSNAERAKVLALCTEEGVDAISYGNGVTSKVAAQQFKSGKGQVLVGTTANYGQGIDLPAGTAPVIFFLRPGYPNPSDPGAEFQLKRFGRMYWPLVKWRIMLEALQVRGRNIRSRSDVGVTFFIDRRFGPEGDRIVSHAVPKWLLPAVDWDKSFDEYVVEAEELLLANTEAA